MPTFHAGLPPAPPVAAWGVAPAFSPVAAAASRRSWLAIVGGVLAMVAVVVILAACVFPFANYNDASLGTSSPSIFNVGYTGGLWYAAEPVAVIVLGLAAAVMVVALTNRTALAAACGVLLAFGAQTFFMFVGYLGGSATLSGSHAGIGSILGVIGGLLLFSGGLTAGISVVTHHAQGPQAADSRT